MKFYIKITIICLGIVIGLISLTYFTTVVKYDDDCYKEIALEECSDKTLDSFYGFMGFECCEQPRNSTSRLAIDQMPRCYNYDFLVKDHNKCSVRYKHWKRV